MRPVKPDWVSTVITNQLELHGDMNQLHDTSSDTVTHFYNVLFVFSRIKCTLVDFGTSNVNGKGINDRRHV